MTKLKYIAHYPESIQAQVLSSLAVASLAITLIISIRTAIKFKVIKHYISILMR